MVSEQWLFVMIIYVFVILGGATSHIFFRWVVNSLIHCLNPYPQRNSVLVLDNASIHHYAPFRMIAAYIGVRIVYLPPYSPHLNMIELFFNVMKKMIRKYYYLARRHPVLTLIFILERFRNNFNVRRAMRRAGYRAVCRR